MDAIHYGVMPGLAAPELAHEVVAVLPTLGASATHVLVTPTNEKAPDTPHVRGPIQNQLRNAMFDQADGYGKRSATLSAYLVFGGLVMQDGDYGSFVVSRWGRSRPLSDRGAVSAFLRQIGGHHG